VVQFNLGLKEDLYFRYLKNPNSTWELYILSSHPSFKVNSDLSLMLLTIQQRTEVTVGGGGERGFFLRTVEHINHFASANQANGISHTRLAQLCNLSNI
jgi:hypothetical protein